VSCLFQGPNLWRVCFQDGIKTPIIRKSMFSQDIRNTSALWSTYRVVWIVARMWSYCRSLNGVRAEAAQLLEAMLVVVPATTRSQPPCGAQYWTSLFHKQLFLNWLTTLVGSAGSRFFQLTGAETGFVHSVCTSVRGGF